MNNVENLIMQKIVKKLSKTGLAEIKYVTKTFFLLFNSNLISFCDVVKHFLLLLVLQKNNYYLSKSNNCSGIHNNKI